MVNETTMVNSICRQSEREEERGERRACARTSVTEKQLQMGHVAAVMALSPSTSQQLLYYASIFFFSLFFILCLFAHSAQSSFSSKPNLTPMVRSSLLFYHSLFRFIIFIYFYGLPALMRSTNLLHLFDDCMYNRRVKIYIVSLSFFFFFSFCELYEKKYDALSDKCKTGENG